MTKSKNVETIVKSYEGYKAKDGTALAVLGITSGEETTKVLGAVNVSLNTLDIVRFSKSLKEVRAQLINPVKKKSWFKYQWAKLTVMFLDRRDKK